MLLVFQHFILYSLRVSFGFFFRNFQLKQLSNRNWYILLVFFINSIAIKDTIFGIHLHLNCQKEGLQ
jgi:hypothetical protein